jgi:hypothetical protein
MEAQQLSEQQRVVTAVAPSVVQMPNKVMQQRQLDGRGGGVQITSCQPMIEECKRGELHSHADRPHQIEFAPADECIHGSGSWR